MGQVYRYLLLLTPLLALSLLVPSGGAKADENGLEIFIENRCYTCHTINAEAKQVEKEKEEFAKARGVEAVSTDEEERIGVDLSDIGKRRDAESLKKFLKNPKPYFKEAFLCQRKAKKKYRKRFRGTPEELETLVTYLSGLKYESEREEGFESCLKEQ